MLKNDNLKLFLDCRIFFYKIYYIEHLKSKFSSVSKVWKVIHSNVIFFRNETKTDTNVLK